MAEIIPQPTGDVSTESTVKSESNASFTATPAPAATSSANGPAPGDTTASVKMMITKAGRQQLADLGYSTADVDAMKPAEAARIIEAGETKAAPPVETPKTVAGLQLEVSYFKSKNDNQPRPAQVTWEALVDMVRNPEIRSSKDGKLICPAQFVPRKRAKKNAKQLSGLWLDLDHNADFERDTSIWLAFGYATLAYTTHSHLRLEPKEQKFRIFIPFNKPIPAEKYPLLWQWASKQNPMVDESARDVSRMFYTPVRASEDDNLAPYRFLVRDGAAIDWEPIVAEEERLAAEEKARKDQEQRSKREDRTAIRKLERDLTKRAQKNAEKRTQLYVRSALDGECAAVAATGKGGRNNRVFTAARRVGSLLHYNVFAEGEARWRLADAASACGLEEHRAQISIDNGIRKGIEEPALVPESAPQSYREYISQLKEAFPEDASPRLAATKIQFLASDKQDFFLLSRRVWKAIAEAEKESPIIMRYLGRRVRCIEVVIKGRATLVPEPLTPEMMMARLIYLFSWYDINHKTRDEFACTPPLALAKLMCAQSEGEIEFKPPELVQITFAPTFAQDGRLIQKPGLDRQSGILYLPTCDVPEIPEVITREMLDRAVKLISDDLLGEFPFPSRADKQNVIGLLLVLFIRLYIIGRVPLFLVEASAPGAGKGTLVEIIKTIVFGSSGGFGTTTMSDDEGELRKEITSHLITGKGAVCFDNLVGEIDSPTLAMLLTASDWDSRLLGKNATASVQEPTTVFMGTGNNAQFTQELTRRIIPIRLVPQTDRPEDIVFKNPLIIEWTLEHRGELIHAALTIIRYWQQHGSPAGEFVLNSYNRFGQVISGILECAGMPEFGKNMRRFSARADKDRTPRADMCNAWCETVKEDPYSANKTTIPISAGKLLEAIGDRIEGVPIKGNDARARSTSFGTYLKTCEDTYPTYTGWTWEKSENPDAEQLAVETAREKKSGAPKYVQRTFRIFTDGLIKGSTAWRCELVSETILSPPEKKKSGPSGPSGPLLDPPQVEQENETDAFLSHDDIKHSVYTHVNRVEPVSEGPLGPLGPLQGENYAVNEEEQEWTA